MKAAFHRDAFRRVDYLLVNPIANKGGDLDQTPRMQKKKKFIYNCTFSAVFICLYFYMNLTFNRGPAFGGENMEQVGRFPTSPEFCFENSMY